MRGSSLTTDRYARGDTGVSPHNPHDHHAPQGRVLGPIERAGRACEAKLALRSLHEQSAATDELVGMRPGERGVFGEDQAYNGFDDRAKDLIRLVLAVSRISRRQVESRLGISPSTLEKWLDAGETHRRPPASMLLQMLTPGSGVIDEAARRRLVRELCNAAGALDVLEPEQTGQDAAANANVGVMRVQAELGDVAEAVANAMSVAGDGGEAITQREAAEMLQEIEQVITQALAVRTVLRRRAGVMP